MGAKTVAATLDVAADGTSEYSTIGAALAAAPRGAVIRVRPGRYEEQLVMVRDVVLEATTNDGDVVVVGHPNALLVRNCRVSLRGIHLRSAPRILDEDGFYFGPMCAAVVEGGLFEVVGCRLTSLKIGNDGRCHLRGCIVEGAENDGVQVDSGDVVIEDSFIAGHGWGGVRVRGGVVRLMHCDVVRNEKEAVVGMGKRAHVEATSCTIDGEVSTCSGAYVLLERCLVDPNAVRPRRDSTIEVVPERDSP